MIKEKLQRMGLTPGESELYELLILSGETKAGLLIKKTSLASSKVYDVLQRLVNKGLASFVVKNGVKYYQATPPERLIDFLEVKKIEIKKVQIEITKLIPLIKEKQESKEEASNVRMYMGTEGPKIVLKETIEAGRKGEKLYGFGTDEDPYKDYLPADIQQHFRDQKKYKIKWYLLFSEKWKSPKNYKAPLQEARYLPEGLTLPTRTMIYGNKIAIVDFNKPFTTIIIESKDISQSYKNHFNMLWRLAKKNPIK